MTIVKELNNLSKKVTGKEGKATTDAQAVKFIADNYEGGGGSYVLPTASADTLGGIKVGSNLSIDANGVLSATGGGSSVEPVVFNIDDYLDTYYDAQKEANYFELTSEDKAKVSQLVTALESDKTIPIYFVSSSFGYMKATTINIDTAGSENISASNLIGYASTESGMLFLTYIGLSLNEITICQRILNDLTHPTNV